MRKGKMVIKSIIGATCACLAVVSFSADAALVGKLAATPGGDDYQAYYDDVADLTWLADANYAMTSGYDADGAMNWVDANAWAADLSVGGNDNWRLASALDPDGTSVCTERETCAGSEMGNLFFNVLGGIPGSSITTVHNANYDLFSNVQSAGYWSATELSPGNIFAWVFNMDNGRQYENIKTYNNYAWAVQSGDAVPVPAAVWLFGSGLIGLIGIAKRKKA